MTPNTTQGITLVTGQSCVPSLRTCHTAVVTGGRISIRRTGQAAPSPLPRGEGALKRFRGQH